MRVRSVASLASIPFCLVSLAACTVSSNDDSPAGSAPSAPSNEAVNAPTAPAAATPSNPAESAPAPAAADTGAVFTISNAQDANEVLAFERDVDGKLTPAGVHPTGGNGTGSGLGSQGALALSEDGKVLVVVDAGSNQISSFTVAGANLVFRSRVWSGGTTPISVTVHGSLVYALNAGSPSNISGFRLDAEAHLSPIDASTRMLSTATAAPAQVSFNPKGDTLVVTEKNTDKLDTFVVSQTGLASAGEAFASSGKTPFGFAFAPSGALVVTEAFGAAAGMGATSTYNFDMILHAGAKGGAERGVTIASASIANAQTAPCWAVVTKDGRFAYTSNTPSGTLSMYALDATGKLTLVGDGAAAKTGDGSKPVDLTLDKSNKHLYVLNSGTRQIKEMDVAADGSLTAHADGNPDLPASAFGLVGF